MVALDDGALREARGPEFGKAIATYAPRGSLSRFYSVFLIPSAQGVGVDTHLSRGYSDWEKCLHIGIYERISDVCVSTSEQFLVQETVSPSLGVRIRSCWRECVGYGDRLAKCDSEWMA
ncbi:MAG: hypothetical protein ACYDHP_13220 [Ferrimicrobium sp.]